MKIALAVIYQAFDLPFLKLHLPVYMNSGALDGLVALSGDIGWTLEADKLLKSFGAEMSFRPFDDNFGAQRNALIEQCERAGFDAVLVMDCDELMMPGQLPSVKVALGAYKALYFPRYHFIGDRLHHAPQWYPDPQLRAWRLNEGLRYRMRVHEVPDYQALGWRHQHEIATLENVPIYHYAWLKSADERDYRTAYYDALGRGLPLPNREDFHGRTLNIPCVPYSGEQPLDPNEIGMTAPFEEVEA